MPVITDALTLRGEILEKPFSEENYRSLLGEIFGTGFDLSYEPVEEEYEGFKVLREIYLDGKSLIALSVKVENPRQLENLRKYHHRKVIKYLRDHHIDSALVAFYCEGHPNWRLSLFYIDYKYDPQGNLIREESPYRRFTYLLGETEPAYTPTKQLWELIEKTREGERITLEDLKNAFSVEKLSDEFFQKYRDLYLKLKEHIEKANPKLVSDLSRRGYTVEDFSKKILGQLVFLYFLQKKGWLGVPQDKPYGEGDRKFLRHLFEKAKSNNKNFYNDYLELLFYNTLNNPRTNQAVPDWSEYFNCRIPFLNGGLFEPIYDYENNFVFIDNELFSNENKDGILDVFDAYNFTIKEDEPLDKEVAVDPEMLGKVFENLISENERKGSGAFYTPRWIVHYMSQQSLIYYLANRLNINKQDIEKIFSVDEYEKLPEVIRKNAKNISAELRNIKVIDPACGSGAFLVGILHEIVKARSLLERTEDLYRLKKEAIENSIYGVDIDIGAVEIAKLRLWLSLVVDEENKYRIRPLPNLEYKIMCGNSLVEELIVGKECISLVVKEQNNNNNEKLFKSDADKLFEELIRLQHEFFNKHNLIEKRKLKEKIEKILKDFVVKKIEEELKRFYEQVNFIVVKHSSILKKKIRKIETYTRIISELEEYKQTLNLKGCNRSFFLWHLNFSEVFREKGGFDIVIANPPYGIKVSTFNKNKYKHYDKQKNSASFFLELALKLGNKGSIFTYIVPKSLTFSEGWQSVRSLILEKSSLKVIIDVSKAFEHVKLEQVIVICINKQTQNDYEFLTGESWNSKINIIGKSQRSLAKKLNTIPIYIDKVKLSMLEKIGHNSVELQTISKTYRGLPLQSSISRNGTVPILRGKNIKKYIIYGDLEKASLNPYHTNRKKVKELMNPKIVSQNIVAHVMNPHDRIIIMATFDKKGFITLDTVMNTFITNDNFSYQYILALLNSKLAEWYFYWIVYNRAIRTMHFDKYYMGKLPVKNITLDEQKPFIELVNKILNLTDNKECMYHTELKRKVKEYSNCIDYLIYKIYNLTEKEIETIESGTKKWAK